MTEAVMGFVPNSALTMARMPQLTMAYSMLAGVVFGADLRVLMERYADTDRPDRWGDFNVRVYQSMERHDGDGT